MRMRIAGLVVTMLLAVGAEAGGDITPVAAAPAENGCATNWYVGAGAAIQRTYAGNSSWSGYELGQDKTLPVLGILGYRFNCYFAVEGRVAQSVMEEDYADVLTYSIFLKPMYPVSEDFTVYGLLGYGVVRVEGTDGNTPAANVGKTIVDKGNFQWGFGMAYDLTENWSLFVDYTMLMHKASIDPQPLYDYDVGDGRNWDQLSDDAINMGVTYRF